MECDVAYKEEKDIGNKINKFQLICGTIGTVLKKEELKETAKILWSGGGSHTATWLGMLGVKKKRSQITGIFRSEVSYISEGLKGENKIWKRSAGNESLIIHQKQIKVDRSFSKNS